MFLRTLQSLIHLTYFHLSLGWKTFFVDGQDLPKKSFAGRTC